MAKRGTKQGKGKAQATTKQGPASAADWLVLRAKYLKGTARYAPALFYAADEMLREGRGDDAAKLVEEFRALTDDARAPNEHTRRLLLAGYLDERLGNASPGARAKRLVPVDGNADGYQPALAASGFPYQATKFGGLESSVPADVWRGLAPVLRCLRNRDEHDRLPAAVDAAVSALPRREPDVEQFKEKALAWAAGYVLVGAGLAKKLDAVAAVNKFHGKAIEPAFQLACQLGLGKAAEAKKVALTAAKKAAAILADADDHRQQWQMEQVITPCTMVALAMGDAALAPSILALATDAVHEAKGTGGHIKDPIHAMLAAHWAQAGDVDAAERELKEARAIAKKVKDRHFAQSMATMLVNACAKLRRRDEAEDAAAAISSRDVKAAVLATLFVELGDPDAAMEVVAKQKKKDVAAELCAECAANFLENELFYILAPQR